MNTYIIVGFVIILNIFWLLQTFSKSNLFAVKVLSALEEWVSEDTEKYLNTKRLVLSWKDVASVVGSENPEGIIVLYFLGKEKFL